MMWPHEVGLEPGGVRKERNLALGVSLALHAVVFVALMEAPGVQLPRASESEYKQAIAGKEEKLIWYKFRRELPRVTPPAAKKDTRPLRAETIAKQAIVSSPKDAPKRDRMVWAPVPPVVAPPPLESPNVLAIKLPGQPFVAPPDVVKTPTAKVDLPPAPALQPLNAATAQVQLHLPPKPFAAPQAQPKLTPTPVPLAAEAPQLASSLVPGAPGTVPAAKLPPKPFAPPAGSKFTPSAVPLAAEAPQLVAGLASAAPATLPGAAQKLPPRPFTAPPGSTRAASVAQPGLEGPPNSTELNVAIVGLNPLERATALPSAPSPASFSAGPKLNPNGAVSEGSGKGLSVPDLFVRGAPQNKPDLIAQAHAAPTSAETLRAAMRNGEPFTTVREAPQSTYQTIPPATSTRVAMAPDPRFNGRDVFMMAIQMPNLTSYSGSWLMWYADRTAREAGLAPIAAPVPHRKVDPKYVPAAVEERVEGKVTLGCVVDREGKVSGVELIRGIDSRLNQTAQEALAKWEFYPATRDGLPIEVDVLVEIPFKLAPKPTRR